MCPHLSSSSSAKVTKVYRGSARGVLPESCADGRWNSRPGLLTRTAVACWHLPSRPRPASRLRLWAATDGQLHLPFAPFAPTTPPAPAPTIASRLAHSFWKPNEYNVRGGVEAGFMSTTTNRAVAIGYAGGLDASGAGQTPMVFEYEQGMIDRGAELDWLSQYPHEKEGSPLAPRASAS